MSTARKDDTGKLRYDLIPPGPLRELAWVYTMGAKKYGDNNWQGGLARERIVAALMRHMEKYRAGEQRDAEDGQLHLSSVAWCAFALMWYDMNDEERVADDDHQKHVQIARRTWGADIERKLNEQQFPGLARSCGQAYEKAATISSEYDGVAKELDRTAKRVPGAKCVTPHCPNTAVGGNVCNVCLFKRAEDGRRSFS